MHNASNPLSGSLGYQEPRREAAVAKGQVRRVSRRVVIVIGLVASWSFASDLITLLSQADGRGPDLDLALAVLALAGLTFGILISAIRSSVGTLMILAGAFLQILDDPPLLAIFVLLINASLVAYAAERRFGRLHLILASGWVVLHVILVPGSQWVLWGFIPSLLVLHVLGAHVARLHDDNADLLEQSRQERETQRVAVEAERRNIARDLHDIVAHDMTLVAMQADAARLSDDPERVRMFLDGISDASHQSLHDLRVIMKVLAPRPDDRSETSARREATPVSNQSLRREIEDAADRLAKLGFEVAVRIEGDLDQVYRASQVALAPVIRECATNIIKHTASGDSRFATVEVFALAGPLTIRVTSGPIDGGSGNTSGHDAADEGSAVPSGKFGLLCLAERMQLMGGTFHSSSVDDRWVVETSLREGVPVF